MGSDVGSVRSFPYPTHNHRGLLAQGGLSGMFTTYTMHASALKQNGGQTLNQESMVHS